MRTVADSGRREGFVLVTVLSMVAVLGILAAVVSVRTSELLAAARRRGELERSYWSAEACIARAHLAMDAALTGDVETGPTSRVWRSMDIVVHGAVDDACDGSIDIMSAGAALDLNEASGLQLRRLLSAAGHSIRAADSLADAILDWRDPDTLPRRGGGERSWYESAGRRPPRDAPFADVAELALVRGADAIADMDVLFAVESGPISLLAAPPVVLASLPGVDHEVIDAIVRRRETGEMLHSLATIETELSSSSRDSLSAHATELERLTTIEPRFWTIVARGDAGPSGAQTTVEVRLARVGTFAIVVRRRIFP